MLEYALPFHSSHATPTSRPDAAAANQLSPHARASSLLDHSLPPLTLAGAQGLLFLRAFRAAGGRSGRRHPSLNLAACAACASRGVRSRRASRTRSAAKSGSATCKAQAPARARVSRATAPSPSPSPTARAEGVRPFRPSSPAPPTVPLHSYYH